MTERASWLTECGRINMRLRNATARELAGRTAASLCYFEPAGPLSWPTLFGNDRPVEVEVGCGKGLFLLTAATEQPLRNFLGIEIGRKYAAFVADRAARRGLANVRVARADARQVLRDWIAGASVAALHVYFPDPWWKRRHKRRRLFTAEFVAQAARALSPGGELRIATDVQEYFGVMQQLLAGCAAFNPANAPMCREPQHDLDYLTNFERKFRKAGKSIFHACYLRGTSPMENRTSHETLLSDLERMLDAAVTSERRWQDALDAVLTHLQLTTGTIHRLNRTTGLLELQAHTGIPDAVLGKVKQIPIGKGMAGIAAERGEPVQVCNLQRDESGVVRPSAKQIAVQGAIAVPMFAGGELRGVLGVAASEECEFDAGEVKRLEAIATQIGKHLADLSA